MGSAVGTKMQQFLNRPLEALSTRDEMKKM
jgi:hypothetical protein